MTTNDTTIGALPSGHAEWRSFPAPPFRALLWLALYLGTTWGVLEVLASGGAAWLRGGIVALALFSTIPLLSFLMGGGWRTYPGAAFRLFVMRPFWYVQLLLPLVAAAGLTGAIAGLPFGHSLAAGRIMALATLTVLGVLLVLGYFGSRRLVVREVMAYLPGLPGEFEGLRVVQLSDLHVGPHSPRSFLTRVARTVGTLAPDLIVVTGDLIDDRAEDVTPYSEAFGGLAAPHGVYLIPGNHDIYAGWSAVQRGLRESLDAHVLVNESRVITRGEARLAIVGIGDPAARRGPDSHAGPDLARAFGPVPDDVTALVLAHNPVLWPAIARRAGTVTLSGHTHWGQFAIPGLGWSLASPFLEHAMGAHASGGALLYIHPGTGYWGIPFRLGAAPEVAVITLRRASESAIVSGPPRAA